MRTRVQNALKNPNNLWPQEYLVFGRAGLISGSIHAPRRIGGVNYIWSSIVSTASDSYTFDLSDQAVIASNTFTHNNVWPLRCLVNSTVGRLKNRKQKQQLGFFGRAGYLYTVDSELRVVGVRSLIWSSVSSADSFGRNFGFYDVAVFSSDSNSRIYGFPLRCLVNSTVGD